MTEVTQRCPEGIPSIKWGGPQRPHAEGDWELVCEEHRLLLERVLGIKVRPEIAERLPAFTVCDTPAVMALKDVLKLLYEADVGVGSR